MLERKWKRRPFAGRRDLSLMSIELEPELRTNSDTEIVMCAIVEEHIVSGFQSQANRSGERLDTGGRIECEVSGTCAQANRVGKPGWSVGPGHTKVVES